MISQTVEVVESTPDYLLVKPQQGGCQSCSSGSCGISNFAHLFGKRHHLLKVTNTGRFEVGEIAELQLDESLFVRAVIVQYLLPLLAMFLMVLLVTFISADLVFQLAGAISGLIIGVVVSRYLMQWYEYRVDGEHLKLRHTLP